MIYKNGWDDFAIPQVDCVSMAYHRRHQESINASMDRDGVVTPSSSGNAVARLGWQHNLMLKVTCRLSNSKPMRPMSTACDCRPVPAESSHAIAGITVISRDKPICLSFATLINMALNLKEAQYEPYILPYLQPPAS